MFICDCYILLHSRENPYHMLTEFALIVFIVWLLCKPESKPKASDKLTKREEDKLIHDWKPDPLVPKDMNTWCRKPVLIERFVC